MELYEKCPQAFWHRYIAKTDIGEQRAPSYMRVGRAVHAALQAAAETVKVEGTAWDSDRVRLVAEMALNSAWSSEHLPETGGLFHQAMETLHGALMDSKVAAPRVAAPEIDAAEVPVSFPRVVGIEHQLLDVTDDGTTFVGYIDRLDQTDDESVTIVDYKVSTKVITPEEVQSSSQMNLYDHFVRREFPWVRRVRLAHYYVPVRELVETDDDPELVIDTLARFEAFAEDVETETEWKPRPGDACASCVYARHCPVWGPDGVP